MSLGPIGASLKLENHFGVRRVVANTLLAQKRWAEAEAVSAAAIAAWARSVPLDTLKHFYARDYYGVEELEALVEIQLRA